MLCYCYIMWFDFEVSISIDNNINPGKLVVTFGKKYLYLIRIENYKVQ